MGISPVFTQHKPEHVHVHTGRGRFLPSRSRGSWIPAERCPSPELPPGLRKQREGPPGLLLCGTRTRWALRSLQPKAL